MGPSCSRGLVRLCSDPEKFEGRGVLFFQESVSCFPVTPLLLLLASPRPIFGRHPPRTSSPRSTSRDPRTLPGSAPERRVEVAGSDVPDSSTSLAFPSSSPGPGTGTPPGFRGLGLGVDSCCEVTPPPIVNSKVRGWSEDSKGETERKPHSSLIQRFDGGVGRI